MIFAPFFEKPIQFSTRTNKPPLWHNHSHLTTGKNKYFIFSSITTNITAIQPVRNEAAHGESTSFHTCETLRNMVVGIGESGALCDFIRFRKLIGK
jgi:hypothetical protein